MTPLTSYIASGQTEEKGRIGLEIEHFVLNDETGAPMPYLELVKLLEFLKESYEKAVYEEDHLIALESNTTLITLEPGCQLELSFRCSANLEHIKTWYEEAVEPIQNYLHRQGYALVYSGGLPNYSIDKVQRIPKERYALMEKWFETSGKRGKEMMKGTASIHLSIDYENEEDFICKYRVANYLHYLFNFITSNTPIYQGVENGDVLLRSSIWEGTDPERCGFMPNTFDPDFGYFQYANWLEKMPLIVLNDGTECKSAGQSKVFEVAKTYGYSSKMIAHYLSMVFPFIRVKKFIEIRSADAMPEPYMMAYCALINGLFYDPSVIEHYWKLSQGTSVSKLEAYGEKIRQDGWSAKVYGSSLSSVLEDLVRRAEQNLDQDERAMLAPLKKCIYEKKHIYESEGLE